LWSGSKEGRGHGGAAAGAHQLHGQLPAVGEQLRDRAGLPPAAIAAAGEDQGVDAGKIEAGERFDEHGFLAC